MRRTSKRISAVAIGTAAAVLIAELALSSTSFPSDSVAIIPDPYLHHVHLKNRTFVAHHSSGEFGGFELFFDSEGRIARPATAKATAKAVALRTTWRTTRSISRVRRWMQTGFPWRFGVRATAGSRRGCTLVCGRSGAFAGSRIAVPGYGASFSGVPFST